MRSSFNDGAESLLLSTYDQTLGGGLPALFRMLCFDYVPDLERLAVSLDMALERFPRFATKIVMTPEGGSGLVPLDEPLLIEVRPPVEWISDDFEVEQIPAFVGGLEKMSGQPALAVTLTPVTDGAVLSVSFSHAIGDMCSFYSFLAFWSEKCRASSLPSNSSAGIHPRAAISEPEEAKASMQWGCEGKANIESGGARKVAYDYTRVKFGQAFLNSLQAELTTENFAPTVNEALMAFLVNRYGPEVMGRTTGLRLRIPVNVRGMHPAIPHNYIGNAILEAIVPLEVLIDAPSTALQTVRRIRDAIAAVKKREYVEDTLLVHDSSVSLRGKGLPIYDREIDILSTVLSSMHFHKLDFGAGAPTQCFGMSTAYKGFSIGAGAGGVEVHIFSDRGTISSIGKA